MYGNKVLVCHIYDVCLSKEPNRWDKLLANQIMFTLRVYDLSVKSGGEG